MIKENVLIDKDKCRELSVEFFAEISGMNREGSKGRRIRQGGMAMHQTAYDAMDIKARYLYLTKDEFTLDGQKLTMCDYQLSCQAFEQVDPAAVEGLYLYVGCAGDFTIPEESVLNQVYVDLWGSAYTDAVRICIREILAEKDDLSETFGPGFFGMPVSDIVKFSQLLDFDELGIRVNSSNTMIPVKSCCGIYFAVNDNYERLGVECRYCSGTNTSCNLCSIYNER